MRLHKEFDPIVDRNSVSYRNCLLIIWWKLVVIIAQSHLFTLQCSQIFFSTIKIIDEYHFQFSFYIWKFSSGCNAEMFAIFVRLEKAKVGTRFRGYPPTKLLFLIMTRSDSRRLFGLIQVVSTSEFHEYCWNKSDFNFLIPAT